MYELLKEIPLIDTHVHRTHPGREPEFGQIAGGYIPGPRQEWHSRQTLLYSMTMQALRIRYGMPEDSTNEQVEQERHHRFCQNPQAYYSDLLADRNVEMYCLEIGSPLRGKAFTRDEIDYFNASIPENRFCHIVRIERLVDDLLAQDLPFDEFGRRFELEIDRQIREEQAVGLKSSVAYYGGLDVAIVGAPEAAIAYDRLRHDREDRGAERIFYAYTLFLAVEAAVRNEIPIQIHTGAGGGGYLDFKSFNPVGLTDFLRDKRVLNRAKIVLLHGGHPHEEDTSFLTAQYSNVYTDFSGTFFLCSLQGAFRMRALMERTPMSKLMYGSDGVSFPEVSWFAPDYFRKLFARVMGQLIDEGYMNKNRALEVARMIFRENALDCYSKLRERLPENTR